MEFLKNRQIVFAALAGGALSILACWYLGSPILAAIAAVLFLFSIIVWKWGYWLGPVFSGAAGRSIIDAKFELVPSQDVIIKKSEGSYCATMFMSVELRDTSSFKSIEQKALLMELFERAVSSLRYPVKLSLLVCALELGDYVSKLEEQRSLLEHKKAQLKGKHDADEAAYLERQIEALSAQIRRLSSGEKPMQVLAYAQTSASGITREEVLSRVRSQAQECSALLSNALSCTIKIAAGGELLLCTDWERWVPASKSELEDQVF